jgi:hypothetical protein
LKCISRTVVIGRGLINGCSGRGRGVVSSKWIGKGGYSRDVNKYDRFVFEGGFPIGCVDDLS